jgi:hypothetical protein
MKKGFIIGAVLLFSSIIFFAQQGRSAPASVNFITYAQAGTFGPSTGKETTAGDIAIQSHSTTLQNTHIAGNLYISGHINGEVILRNVSMDGILAINAVGELTLIIQDSQLSQVSVCSATGTINVQATGTTSIRHSEISSQVPLTLSGHYGQIALIRPANLSFIEAQVDQLIITETADNSTIHVSEDSTIAILILEAPINLTGDGTITHANILRDGIFLGLEPQQTTFAPGISLGTPNSEQPSDAPIDDTDLPPVILYRMDSFNLNPGETASQTISTSPVETILTATSTNSNVATVTVSGMAVTVTAHRAGTASITVSSSHEEYSAGSARFTVTVTALSTASPTAEPSPGPIIPGTSITLSSSTKDAIIFYTTDGSDPSTSSTQYKTSAKPTVPDSGFTLHAFAIREGYEPSESVTFTYTIEEPPDEEPPPEEDTDEPTED